MKVLELGSYVAPAYAGMLLAEQGHEVVKWYQPSDSVLDRNVELWAWINYRKTLVARHSSGVVDVDPGEFDIVIDNHRAASWERWGTGDLDVLAKTLGVTWVSLRADDDGRSFDVIAQARAWGDLGMLPFYIGDTAAGLWLAFKALAKSDEPGHYIVRQATALAKLVEGELVVPRADWDGAGRYTFDTDARTATVMFRGSRITEPFRDAQWRRENLDHENGRFVV